MGPANMTVDATLTPISSVADVSARTAENQQRERAHSILDGDLAGALPVALKRVDLPNPEEMAVDGARSPRAIGRPSHVLVVEHDPSTRDRLTWALMEAGYEVVQASNAWTALRRLFADRPDAVLLDPVLPEGGGLAVLDGLRGDQQTCATPVLVFNLSQRLRLEVESWRVDAVVRTPLCLDDVVGWLGRTLGSYPGADVPERDRTVSA